MGSSRRRGAASPAGAGAGGGLANPAAMASLAFRRWSSGLTLSSPQAVPSLEVLWPFVVGIGVLLVLAVVLQGPLLALKQLVDLPGHIALVRLASQRSGAGRLVAAVITVTVLAWTGSQTLGFLADKADRGKAELTLLTRSRAGSSWRWSKAPWPARRRCAIWRGWATTCRCSFWRSTSSSGPPPA